MLLLDTGLYTQSSTEPSATVVTAQASNFAGLTFMSHVLEKIITLHTVRCFLTICYHTSLEEPTANGNITAHTPHNHDGLRSLLKVVN
jgi:hypothetical protein